jgi:hypothetical protein
MIPEVLSNTKPSRIELDRIKYKNYIKRFHERNENNMAGSSS